MSSEQLQQYLTYLLTETYIPEPDIREDLLSRVNDSEAVREQLIPDPPAVPTEQISISAKSYFAPHSELHGFIIGDIVSKAVDWIMLWLLGELQSAVNEVSSLPKGSAPNYRKNRNEIGPSLLVDPSRFDLEEARRSIEIDIRAAIDEEDTVRYVVVRGLTFSSANGTDLATEVCYARRRHAAHMFPYFAFSVDDELRNTSLEGRIYLLECMLSAAPGEWPREDELSPLRGRSFSELVLMRNEVDRKELEAVDSSLWYRAANMYVSRLMLEKVIEDKICSATQPPNPFAGTSKAYGHCQRVLEAWDEGCESERPMDQMKHLWREVGDGADTIKQTVRQVLLKVGVRAGSGYESGNPQSFVAAVQKVVDTYDEPR